MSDPLSSRSLYLLPNHDDIVQRTRQRLPTASTVPFRAGNPPACATLELRTTFALQATIEGRLNCTFTPQLTA